MAQSSFQGFLSPRPDKKGNSLIIKSKQVINGNLSGGSLSANIPISAVDTTKTVVYLSFSYSTVTTTISSDLGCSVKLTSSTNVLITRSGSTDLISYSIQVIEYYNVKSLQTGQKTITTTSDSILISPVTVNKSIVVYSQTNNSTSVNGITPVSALLSSSAIATTQAGTTTFIMEWQVIEFY